MDSLDVLLTRVACLESALEGATGEGEAQSPYKCQGLVTVGAFSFCKR